MKLLALSLISTQALANPFILRELSLDYKNFKAGSRMPEYDNAMLDKREVGQELNLNFNLDLINEHFFWNNRVWSVVDRWKESGTPSQFRNIGWQFSVGVRPVDWIELGYWHFSKHILDTEYKIGRFPVEDAWQVKVFLFKE